MKCVKCFLTGLNCNTQDSIYHQLTARRVLSLFNDVQLRTRRAHTPYTLYSVMPFWLYIIYISGVSSTFVTIHWSLIWFFFFTSRTKNCQIERWTTEALLKELFLFAKWWLPNGLSLVLLTVGLITGMLVLSRPPLANPVASVLISDMVSVLSRSVSQNTPLLWPTGSCGKKIILKRVK